MTPQNDSALKAKVAPGPTAAISSPPIAGPTERARLIDTLFRETAGASCARGTSSATIACHAGALSAVPRPSAKVRSSSVTGVVNPAKVRSASIAAAANMSACVNSSNRRRSSTSAKAPAGSANKNIGKALAVRTSATITGDAESEVMSQAEPTSCIHVPILEANAAIQSARNNGWRSGASAESFSADRDARSAVTKAAAVLSVAWPILPRSGRCRVEEEPVFSALPPLRESSLPHAHDVVIAGGGDPFAVVRQCQRAQAGAIGAQLMRERSVFDIPHVYAGARSGREQPCPVRTERDAVDRRRTSGERAAGGPFFADRRDRPDPHVTLAVAGGEQAPVRRERRRRHVVLMCVPVRNQFSIGVVPYGHAAARVAREEQTLIRRKAEHPRRVLARIECMQAALLGQLPHRHGAVFRRFREI